MLKKIWLLLAAAVLVLAGCAMQPALAGHEAGQSASVASQSQSLPNNGKEAGVLDPSKDNKGTPRANVPWVTNLPGTTPSADTVAAGAPASILGCGRYLRGWDTLAECVENTRATWYIDAVNARKGKTGFGWSDIQLWASARDENGRLVEARVIEVFGDDDISDEEARRRAAEIVGGAEVAAELPIIRRGKEFMNTWTPDSESLQDYLFSPGAPHAVRVSLVPLKLDDTGRAIGLYINTPSGIFVDCANLWWIPLAVNTSSGEPPTPPAPPMPGGSTPPTPTPPTPVPPAQKNPVLDPAPQGNAGNGEGRNEDPGPGAFVPSPAMGQPPVAPRVNPDPPPVAPALAIPAPAPPALEIPPAPAPPPEQGAPTPDDPATDCVPAPGEDDC